MAWEDARASGWTSPLGQALQVICIPPLRHLLADSSATPRIRGFSTARARVAQCCARWRPCRSRLSKQAFLHLSAHELRGCVAFEPSAMRWAHPLTALAGRSFETCR